MGWYIKKSWKFGPFRLNLSKSGLGYSFGVKGARIGSGPRGKYLHAGTGGVYYRQSLETKDDGQASTDTGEGSTHCAQCGSEVSETAVFCISCGASLEGRKTFQTPSNAFGEWLAIGLGLLLLVAVIAALSAGWLVTGFFVLLALLVMAVVFVGFKAWVKDL